MSTTAVLTELFHLVGDNAREVEAAWAFIRSGAVTVLPISDRDFSDLDALMAKYRDCPMDFADATLVHLAQREALSTVFTIDHDDFETYRIGGRKRFRIVPARRSLP
jgi:predicted nucleic acid-binding protein